MTHEAKRIRAPRSLFKMVKLIKETLSTFVRDYMLKCKHKVVLVNFKVFNNPVDTRRRFNVYTTFIRRR